MSFIVETGEGLSGAESYATTAFIDGYWAARAHSTYAATWAASTVTTAKKEGAAREASAYLDATFGPYYRGKRRGYVQGLLWPRTDAMDEEDYPLPDLPAVLQQAVAELAVRALSAPLAPDIDSGARVKTLTQKVGPIEKTTEYFDAGEPAPKTYYGVVADMLAPILDGRQPGAPQAAWTWS